MMTSAAATLTPSAPGKSLPPELNRALGRVADLNSLPEVTTKILAVVESPQATARELHEVVRADPALATKLLRIVNSAFYGLPSQVASLDRAIVMLGLTAIKNLALASSLARMIKAGPISMHFETRDLWRHCLATGVCARGIATTGRAVPPDEAMVAGLVHDMGLIVMQQLFTNQVRRIAEQCMAKPQSYCAAELGIVGADHQAFGGVLATKWKFPATLRNAIAYHHEPHVLQPELQLLTLVVHVADSVCCQAQYGYYLTGQDQSITPELLERLRLSREQLDEILAGLPERVAEAEQVFTTSA